MMKGMYSFQHPPPQQRRERQQPRVRRPGKGSGATQGQDRHSERFKDRLNSVNVKESSISILSGALNYVRLSAIESCNALDLKVVKDSGTNNNNNDLSTSAPKSSGGSAGKGNGTPGKSVFIDDGNPFSGPFSADIDNDDGDDFFDDLLSDDIDDIDDIDIINDEEDDALFEDGIDKKKDKLNDGSKGQDTDKDGKSKTDEVQATQNKEEFIQKIFNKANEKVKELRGTPDEFDIEDFAAILSYTMESEPNGVSSIYKTINSALAQRAAAKTIEGGGYVLNLLSAIRKLPKQGVPRRTLYRGVCGHLNEKNLETGSVLSWPAFTSTTLDEDEAKNFLIRGSINESKGEWRYMFKISGNYCGYDISQFSDFTNEKGK